MMVRSIVLGLKIDIVTPSSHPFEGTFREYDFVALVPLQLKNSLKYLNRVKKVIVGGAAISNKLVAQIQNAPCEIYETFGMTETITHIALKKLNHSNHFVALPTVTFNKTPDNCLTILAPHISNTPLITNDKIELLSPTSFAWLGRKDNVINTGGIKIQAEELEFKISQVISDHRFFITTIKDEFLGEKIVLILEAEATFDVSKLPFKSLDKYSIPKAIYTIPKFIETETGKIKRKENKALLGLI